MAAPITENRLRAYARLIVEAGCALRKGQDLYVRAGIESAPLVRLIVEEAYKAGSHHVTVWFRDEAIERLHYENCDMEVFESTPGWLAALNNSMARKGAAMLTIDSDDPEGMAGINADKMRARIRSNHEAYKEFYDAMDFGRCVWCIAGAASPAWARKVFPDLPEDEAVNRLWEAIFATVRLDGEDADAAIAAWNKHRHGFAARCGWLNRHRFDALHYRNSHGTDFTVGLPESHIWNGGGDTTTSGVQFFPNMPTEEIFTSPDRLRAEGTVASSMPLAYQGSLIDGFSLTFEGGRVVDLHADQGEELLRSIVETDEDSCRLGEIALVPFNSPIRNQGILFYNTLFDENASCHLALGQGFPDCYEGGVEMLAEDLMERGVNKSATHVDFMIGTEDLDIDGICADGTRVPIFRNGNWAF